MRMMTVAACLWLGLFPLLQGGTYAHITLDKWYIFLIFTGLTLCLFGADFLLRRAARTAPAAGAAPGVPSRAFSPRLLPALLLTAAMILSCLFGGYDAEIWWQGASVRLEGLETQLCYLGLFFLFAFSRVRIRPVLYSAAAAVLLFLVLVLLQRAGRNPLGLYPAGRSYARNPEFQGTIGNIDMGTGWLVMLTGLFLCGGRDALRAWREHKKKAALAQALVCGAGLAAAVFLVLSMGVQFGVIALAVLLLALLLRLLPRKWRLPALILLLALALLVVWFWPGYGGGIWELHEMLHGRARLSFGSNRVAVWYYSLPLAKQNLLLGGGSDTFVLRFNDHLRANALVIPNEQDGVRLPDYFDTPHNEYLAQWLNHGLPAAVCFILLIVLALWRRREGLLPLLTPCSAAALCYAVQAFFSFSVCIIAPMFWVVLGICHSAGSASGDVSFFSVSSPAMPSGSRPFFR